MRPACLQLAYTGSFAFLSAYARPLARIGTLPGWGPAWHHPGEASQRSLRLLPGIHLTGRRICLTSRHHHLHSMRGRGSGGTGVFHHTSRQPLPALPSLPRVVAAPHLPEGALDPRELTPGGDPSPGNTGSQRRHDTSTSRGPPRKDEALPGST